MRVKSGPCSKLIQCFPITMLPTQGIFATAPETGGGGLRDIGVYTLGCARYVMGAEFDAFHHVDLQLENDVDVWAGVTGRIADVRYHGVTSMRMALRQSVNIQGDQGVITLTAPFNPGVYSQAEVHCPRVI